MPLASRAFGPESRGTVLGVIAATIGLSGGIGPLLGGALSESFGWQSVFLINTAAAITIPIGITILPRSEDRTGGNLDISGGVALALLVGGALLIPSEGTRSGWTSPLVLAGALVAIIGLVGLALREWNASSPFIPKEFLLTARYVALGRMSFSVMAANLAVLIGLPILLTTFHQLSPLEGGLAMVPGAVSMGVFGALAGRVTDRNGARLPPWVGAPLMLLAVLGLSTYAGSSVWVIATFTGILGAGFGLVNTPLAATVSRIVRSQMLASAMSINSMLFFLGGSLGTALLMAITTSRGGDGQSAFNPLHSGVGAGFSDAFLPLAIPVVLVMALSVVLPKAQARGVAMQPGLPVERKWVANCSIPWTPECAEITAAGFECVFPIGEAEFASSGAS